MMICASKLIGGAAVLLVAFALAAAPAQAQLGGLGSTPGGAGGQDMMTQMAPMLNMMKAKMGKKRFAMMMQTMGPMMSQMMQGGGFGSTGGGFSGFGGGGIASGVDVGSIMGMVGPMIQMANLGGGVGHHRHPRQK
jgi:hypothetical protein